MKAAIEAMSSKKLGSYKTSRVFIICLPPNSSHKIQPLNKAFMGPPKTFCRQEIEKWLRSNPGRFVNVYPIGKQFGIYKHVATDASAAYGCRTTGLFRCDMNIFRTRDSPLVSGNTNGTPVNHPALVKSSDQPSFCSSNFRRSFLLMLSVRKIFALCQV
jgi:hypothetical protein